jgi:hypothetical protein
MCSFEQSPGLPNFIVQVSINMAVSRGEGDRSLGQAWVSVGFAGDIRPSRLPRFFARSTCDLPTRIQRQIDRGGDDVVNNRIDRVIRELVELVDKVMRTRRPLPWPTTSEKYLHHSAQVMAAPDCAMDRDVQGLRLSKPEEPDLLGADSQQFEL